MASGNAAKRRRLSPPEDGTGKAPGNSNSAASLNDFYKQAAGWDLEQDYERRPRKTKKEKESSRLPIKTAEGNIERVEEPDKTQEEDSDNLFDSNDEEEVPESAPPPVEPVETPESQLPPKVQIRDAKEELARISALILEDPEEHIDLFKKLLQMVTSASLVTVKKLALGTQAAVYKDVIPGYRIRPLKDEELSGKVSKDVQKLRTFEQTLVSSYRSYVQHVLESSKSPKRGKTKDDEGLRFVAVKCACSLLAAVPHFNFRGELLRIVVGQLGRRQIDEEFVKARETLEEIFSTDDDGVVSMEAVSLLAKMMKARDYKIHPSVLDTFLHLRLLSEFSSKGSKDSIDKEESENNQIKGKKPKQKREFRTKKERKVLKERKAVEKDLGEADALVGHEQRDRMQAETLKLVFSTYFRILKLRTHRLVGAVLEGLAKYAHLINQDFFGDLLEVLRELTAARTASDGTEGSEGADNEEDQNNSQTSVTRNATREALLCATTAFALLEGQDASKAASSLHLDLSFFITHLYRTLYPFSTNPDIEFNPTKSLRLPDPSTTQSADHNNQPKKINFQTPTVLLLRCLQAVLASRGPAAAPPLRVAAFTKRLLTTSLQMPEKSSLAILSLLTRVTKQHGRRIAPLWNTDERKGDGEFNPVAEAVEGSNVFAGTVWEGELLRMHYCPEVRESVKGIEDVIAGIK